MLHTPKKADPAVGTDPGHMAESHGYMDAMYVSTAIIYSSTSDLALKLSRL